MADEEEEEDEEEVDDRDADKAKEIEADEVAAPCATENEDEVEDDKGLLLPPSIGSTHADAGGENCDGACGNRMFQ